MPYGWQVRHPVSERGSADGSNRCLGLGPEKPAWNFLASPGRCDSGNVCASHFGATSVDRHLHLHRIKIVEISGSHSPNDTERHRCIAIPDHGEPPLGRQEIQWVDLQAHPPKKKKVVHQQRIEFFEIAQPRQELRMLHTPPAEVPSTMTTMSARSHYSGTESHVCEQA